MDIENGSERLESDSESEGREMLERSSQYYECSQAADRSASWCRTITLMVSTYLRLRRSNYYFIDILILLSKFFVFVLRN